MPLTSLRQALRQHLASLPHALRQLRPPPLPQVSASPHLRRQLPLASPCSGPHRQRRASHPRRHARQQRCKRRPALVARQAATADRLLAPADRLPAPAKGTPGAWHVAGGRSQFRGAPAHPARRARLAAAAMRRRMRIRPATALPAAGAHPAQSRCLFMCLKDHPGTELVLKQVRSPIGQLAP